jgi:hypothetical protein
MPAPCCSADRQPIIPCTGMNGDPRLWAQIKRAQIKRMEGGRIPLIEGRARVIGRRWV